MRKVKKNWVVQQYIIADSKIIVYVWCIKLFGSFMHRYTQYTIHCCFSVSCFELTTDMALIRVIN